LRFHPLKAGRRLVENFFVLFVKKVSIPSRRVGDRFECMRLLCSQWFPSPQGGSETCGGEVGWGDCAGFHPLKAGRRPSSTTSPTTPVSSFHPLKAGRRQVNALSILRCIRCFHPLKAGRRLCQTIARSSTSALFPSPQGGSETVGVVVICLMTTMFPSPQGGSET